MADKAQLQEAIKTQGEVVRKLKTEKASKEQVSVNSEVFISTLNEETHGVVNGCYRIIHEIIHECLYQISMAGYELF